MTPKEATTFYSFFFLLIIIGLCLLMAIVSIYDRWHCIDCSETRLFLHRWQIYSACTLLVIGHIWMIVVGYKEQ